MFGRTRKEKGKSGTELLVANDIANVEAVRFNLKTPFDRNVVTQGDYQETILDYAFHHLGLSGDDGVNRPVVVTEAFANPNSSRSIMNELLFECYSVPRVAYGVDALFSLASNLGKEQGNKEFQKIGNFTADFL